jgi:cysteinyl-tRNA synthetase
VIRLYDTLTGETRPLPMRDEGRVSLYACGPTVYDHPHLGHARQALTYDIIRRYLEWTGLEVHHVANVTDIDDNIINRANREGSTEAEIAATWKAVYDTAMDSLDILRPHDRPHATEYVEQMVAFIATLVDNGSAYANDSGVYLRVNTIGDYGGLVHRSLDELREGAGARVEVDENKEDPLDFALWKAAKPD